MVKRGGDHGIYRLSGAETASGSVAAGRSLRADDRPIPVQEYRPHGRGEGARLSAWSLIARWKTARGKSKTLRWMRPGREREWAGRWCNRSKTVCRKRRTSGWHSPGVFGKPDLYEKCGFVYDHTIPAFLRIIIRSRFGRAKSSALTWLFCARRLSVEWRIYDEDQLPYPYCPLWPRIGAG